MERAKNWEGEIGSLSLETELDLFNGGGRGRNIIDRGDLVRGVARRDWRVALEGITKAEEECIKVILRRQMAIADLGTV